MDGFLGDLHQIFSVAFQHHQAGRLGEAERLYRAVLAQVPRHADCLHLLGVIANECGKPEAAARYIAAAIAVAPAIAEYHSNLGETYRTLNRLDDAVASYQAALALKPTLAEAHNNLGIAYQDLNRIDAAIACYGAAIACKAPEDYIEAEWNRALALLLAGDYAEGFKAYDWRWRVPKLPKLPVGLPQQVWRGEAWTGGPLLLHAEQGFGDTIQFARFIPEIAGRGPVLLAVERELVSLIRTLPDCPPVLVKGDPLPPIAAHCPLMSLPQALGVTLATLPAPRQYLSADPAQTARFKMVLGRKPGFHVALTWRGRPDHANDRRRSLPAGLLAGLGGLDGVSFWGVQKGVSDVEMAPLVRSLDLDLVSGLDDFSITAGLLAGMDLVITVDTVIAHLAGALGKPVWLMLPYAGDWRWLTERSDSPWYPSMRIFRQSLPGDWGGVVAEIRVALASEAARARF